MREILKDLDNTVKDEVSTLMRKKNKNKKAIKEASEDWGHFGNIAFLAFYCETIS